MIDLLVLTAIIYFVLSLTRDLLVSRNADPSQEG